MSADTSKILTALDRYVKTAEVNNRAVILHGKIPTERSDALKGHEKRLAAVEAKG